MNLCLSGLVLVCLIMNIKLYEAMSFSFSPLESF